MGPLRPAAAFLAAATFVLPACATTSPPPDAGPPTVPAASNDPLADGEHHVVIDGVRLWYRVAGVHRPGAAPVIFLHGGPGYNSHSFSVFAGPRLERSLRMVYLDQRGSGRSERPLSGNYELARLVEDIDDVRRTLGVHKVVLIGSSFGGTLALEYGARYPQHVASMVLIGGAADIPAACRARRDHLERRYPDDLTRYLADTSSGTTARTDCDVAFNTVPRDRFEAYNQGTMFPRPELGRMQDSVDNASGLRNTGEMGASLFGQGLFEYRFSAHDRLTMPVLVIAGVHDDAIGLPQQRAVARALPNARIIEYEEGGHFPYLEEPDRFAHDVVTFIKANGGSRP